MASATKRGLGSGLAAILPEAVGEDAGELRELPIELIKPNPNQPRTKIDPEALAGLASSIETNGVVQPLLVRPLPDGSYELIAGERRWRAAQTAGLEKVPAVVRDQELAERLQVALIENMVREDLNPSTRRAPAPPWSTSSDCPRRSWLAASAAAVPPSPT